MASKYIIVKLHFYNFIFFYFFNNTMFNILEFNYLEFFHNLNYI